MRGEIHQDNINAYEELRNYKLDGEQVGVIRRIDASDKALFYIKASAGVGKTSVINSLSFSLSRRYGGTSKVVLVLVPNRELRHDICQDVASNVLKTENLLWLGRPPPGRPDGLWDDILDARLKDMQKETYASLDMIKNQLKLTLNKLDDIQPLGQQKWSYITEIFLANSDAAPSAITSFLEVIAEAKTQLRAHIELEIEGLV